jgi:uncharacterized membrane protein (GlpM family)
VSGLLEQRWAQYAVVFLGAGGIAVAIKYASELGENRVAGVVSMVPMKILIAWAIVGAAGGSVAIQQSTTGMFGGLVALVVCIGAVRFAAPYVSPVGLILLALGAWGATVAVLEWIARSGSSEAG